MKSPSPSIIYEMKIGFIMDKESTEARSHDDVVRNPIGTGAYEFVEWIRGSHLTLGANEDSWGGTPPIESATATVLRSLSNAQTIGTSKTNK